jgi:hypothetical protein
VFLDAGFQITESKEMRQQYDRILWKIRDGLRNAIFGDHWGRSEVYVIGRK